MRRAGLIAALAFLATAAPCSHADAPDPALVGCWRAAKIVLHAPDGSKTEDTSGRCTLQFRDDSYESACGTTGGRAVTTTYRYRIVRPGFYAATMGGSTFRTDLLGATREYEYRVEGDRLMTVAQPQANPAAASTGGGRVELEAARISCP